MLVLHFGVVLFVVGGLVVVVMGNWLRWDWVNRFWYRLAHLATIAFVVVQAWLERLCPLTRLESWLRIQAGVTNTVNTVRMQGVVVGRYGTN